MPSMLYGIQELRVNAWATDDRGRGPMPIVHWGLETGSLTAHFQSQHGVGRGPHWDITPPLVDPHINRVSLPNMAGLLGGPFKGCMGREMIRINLWIHFVHLHVQEMIIIMEEGNSTCPYCPVCELFPWVVLNRFHPTTDLCARVEELKRWRLAKEEP